MKLKEIKFIPNQIIKEFPNSPFYQRLLSKGKKPNEIFIYDEKKREAYKKFNSEQWKDLNLPPKEHLIKTTKHLVELKDKLVFKGMYKDFLDRESKCYEIDAEFIDSVQDDIEKKIKFYNSL